MLVIGDLAPHAVHEGRYRKVNPKAELDRQPWIARGAIAPTVGNGVVVLSGTVKDAYQRTALRVAAENIPGVKRVVDDLREIDMTLAS